MIVLVVLVPLLGLLTEDSNDYINEFAGNRTTYELSGKLYFLSFINCKQETENCSCANYQHFVSVRLYEVPTSLSNLSVVLF